MLSVICLNKSPYSYNAFDRYALSGIIYEVGLYRGPENRVQFFNLEVKEQTSNREKACSRSATAICYSTKQ